MTDRINADTIDEFNERLQSGKLTLVVFTGRCPRCVALEPALDQLAAEYSDDLVIMNIDVERLEGISDRYNVMATPTLMIFGRAGERERLRGDLTRSNIAQVIDKHLH